MTVDVAGLDTLVVALGERFPLTVSRDRRLVSVPAPHETADLVAVSEAVGASGVAIDEIALRRPTLDDAFLTLTGQPASSDAAADDLVETS